MVLHNLQIHLCHLALLIWQTGKCFIFFLYDFLTKIAPALFLPKTVLLQYLVMIICLSALFTRKMNTILDLMPDMWNFSSLQSFNSNWLESYRLHVCSSDSIIKAASVLPLFLLYTFSGLMMPVYFSLYSNGTTNKMNGALDHSDQPDPDAIKMFVGQIPRSWSEKELKDLFEPYGAVYQINVLRDRSQNPPQSKGSDLWESSLSKQSQRVLPVLNIVDVARPRLHFFFSLAKASVLQKWHF